MSDTACLLSQIFFIIVLLNLPLSVIINSSQQNDSWTITGTFFSFMLVLISNVFLIIFLSFNFAGRVIQYTQLLEQLSEECGVTPILCITITMSTRECNLALPFFGVHVSMALFKHSISHVHHTPCSFPLLQDQNMWYRTQLHCSKFSLQ